MQTTTAATRSLFAGAECEPLSASVARPGGCRYILSSVRIPRNRKALGRPRTVLDLKTRGASDPPLPGLATFHAGAHRAWSDLPRITRAPPRRDCSTAPGDPPVFLAPRREAILLPPGWPGAAAVSKRREAPYRSGRPVPGLAEGQDASMARGEQGAMKIT